MYCITYIILFIYICCIICIYIYVYIFLAFERVALFHLLQDTVSSDRIVVSDFADVTTASDFLPVYFPVKCLHCVLTNLVDYQRPHQLLRS